MRRTSKYRAENILLAAILHLAARHCGVRLAVDMPTISRKDSGDYVAIRILNALHDLVVQE